MKACADQRKGEQFRDILSRLNDSQCIKEEEMEPKRLKFYYMQVPYNKPRRHHPYYKKSFLPCKLCETYTTTSTVLWNIVSIELAMFLPEVRSGFRQVLTTTVFIIGAPK